MSDPSSKKRALNDGFEYEDKKKIMKVDSNTEKEEALMRQKQLLMNIEKNRSSKITSENRSPLHGISFISPSQKDKVTSSPYKRSASKNTPSSPFSNKIMNYFTKIPSNDTELSNDTKAPSESSNPTPMHVEESVPEPNIARTLFHQTASTSSTPMKQTGSILQSMKEEIKSNNRRTSELRESSKTKSISSSPLSNKKGKFDFSRHPRDFNGLKPGDPDYNPTQLYISDEDWKSMTAAKKQYWEYKQFHFDEIVFFQQGDFFNLFGPDAEIGIEKFGFAYNSTLDSVGFNRKQVRDWVSKFSSLGFKVSIFEQDSTAVTSTEKLLKKKSKAPEIRVVTNTMTSGTMDDFLLFDDSSQNDYASKYIMCIQEQNQQGSTYYGICVVDTSTYEWKISSFIDDERCSQLETILLQTQPKEILYDRKKLSSMTKKIIDLNLTNVCISFLESFPDEISAWDLIEHGGYFDRKEDIPSTLSKFKDDPLAIQAVGGIISYFMTLKRSEMKTDNNKEIKTLDREIVNKSIYSEYDVFNNQKYMILDASSLTNLEIFENNDDGSSKGTLFETLNYSVTAYGKRLLRTWICHPLMHIEDIQKRQETVEFFNDNPEMMERMRHSLQKTKDIERMITRVLNGNIQLQSFIDFLDSFTAIEAMILKEEQFAIQNDSPEYFKNIFKYIGDLQQFLTFYDFDKNDARETNIIKPKQGSYQEYDAILESMSAIERDLEQYLVNVRRKHSLKAEFYQSKTEMYTIKVPENSNNIPSEWAEVSRTKQGCRYKCPYVEKKVNELVDLRAERDLFCKGIFNDYLVKFQQFRTMCQGLTKDLATIDVLMGFSHFYHQKSSQYALSKPTIHHQENSFIHIDSMVHPYVAPKTNNFIPNDIRIGGDSGSNIHLITGPNMGGKSTLLKQVCIVAIMAQIGCFVPCQSCKMTPIDRIFTRVGARDSIIAGKSTFFVEVEETSRILKDATMKSFAIIDELGRGTSTFDGYSIAYSVLKYLEKKNSLVLFSTHYHKLTEEFVSGEVKQYHMASEEQHGEMVFLYKLKEGACPKSFGMNVASMAKIPMEIINRASDISNHFEEIVKRGGKMTMRELKVRELISRLNKVKMSKNAF